MDFCIDCLGSSETQSRDNLIFEGVLEVYKCGYLKTQRIVGLELEANADFFKAHMKRDEHYSPLIGFLRLCRGYIKVKLLRGQYRLRKVEF